MYVTVAGTVTFIEDKVKPGKAGEKDQKFRVVTLYGGAPGQKPENIDVKYMNGTKVEMGQKLTVAARLVAYEKTRDGRPAGAGVSLTAVE